MTRTYSLTIVLCLLAFGASSPAFAQEGEAYTFGNSTETYVLGGLSGGGSFGSPGGGGFIGSELSIAFLKQAIWGGLYVDGAYDFGHEAATFSAGPEFGVGPVGIDGGPALRFGIEDDPEVGGHGRFLISLGTFSVFARYGFWPGSTGAEHVGQVGILLKLPFWNSSPTERVAR